MKNSSLQKRCLLVFMVVFLLGNLPIVAQQKSPSKPPTFPSVSALSKANISAKIIPSEANSWGYDIYVNGERFIHQSSKPGIAGNRGFETQAQAQMVADLIIQKIKQGQMPPSVSIDELKQLKAI